MRRRQNRLSQPPAAGSIPAARGPSVTPPHPQHAGTKTSNVLNPTATYTGHTNVVEDVAWHLHNPQLFGSVGDDCKLMIWDTRDSRYDKVHAPRTPTPHATPFQERLPVALVAPAWRSTQPGLRGGRRSTASTARTPRRSTASRSTLSPSTSSPRAAPTRPWPCGTCAASRASCIPSRATQRRSTRSRGHPSTRPSSRRPART